MTTRGAVGQMSGVEVLFRYAVGPADGIEEFPVGYGGVMVEFSDTIGVADGTTVKLLVGNEEFADGVGNPTDSAVKPVPVGIVELPNGGGRTGVSVGGALVVALLEGVGILEEGAGKVLFVGGDVPAGAVEFADTGGTARDEKAGGEDAVRLVDGVGMMTVAVSTISRVETRTGVELPVPGSVVFGAFDDNGNGFRG